MAMRPASRKWIFALLAVVIAVPAASRMKPINAARTEHELIAPPLPEEVGASMLLKPLLALGRAPLVDYLWMRAMKLKEQGLYFDAHQLSEMICKLQPKFAAVWAFQAWNMAYNISVTMKAPEERWTWVSNGIKLLRDEAIPLNPRNTQLYRELSWIFFHKVGDFMDEMHNYYKLQLALQMEDILGAPPPDFIKPGRVRGDYYRTYDYQPLANSPVYYADLLKKHPEIRPFAGKLRGFGFNVAESGVFLGLISALYADNLAVSGANEGTELDQAAALKAVMTDEKNESARQALEAFWRAKRLREDVKLQPKRIVEIHDAYGVTLDWRLAEAHALYWSLMGLEMGSDVKVSVDVHHLNTQRLEFFCLMKMYQRGRLAMSSQANLGEPPLFLPDIRVIPILFQTYLKDSKVYLQSESHDNPVSENFRSAFVGFCRNAALRYHERDMDAEGRELYRYLKEHYPDPMYARGYDYFIAEQFKSDREINDYRIALARAEALIVQALVRYAYDEDDAALRQLARARQVYQIYNQFVVTDAARIGQPFEEIVRQMAHEFGGRMYRGSYEKVCAKLGIDPLPESADGQTASPEQSSATAASSPFFLT